MNFVFAKIHLFPVPNPTDSCPRQRTVHTYLAQRTQYFSFALQALPQPFSSWEDGASTPINLSTTMLFLLCPSHCKPSTESTMKKSASWLSVPTNCETPILPKHPATTLTWNIIWNFLDFRLACPGKRFANWLATPCTNGEHYPGPSSTPTRNS